jgi:hypothetical protein
MSEVLYHASLSISTRSAASSNQVTLLKRLAYTTKLAADATVLKRKRREMQKPDSKRNVGGGVGIEPQSEKVGPRLPCTPIHAPRREMPTRRVARGREPRLSAYVRRRSGTRPRDSLVVAARLALAQLADDDLCTCTQLVDRDAARISHTRSAIAGATAISGPSPYRKCVPRTRPSRSSRTFAKP